MLQAPTGAGKTTRVPLALLEADWRDGAVLVLEPRRIAARAAARRLAAHLGERVGDTVGYRVRGETRVGRGTQVEVVTEGVLTQRLLRDPGLDGGRPVGVVVFDEVHERSLQSDLGLALVLQARELLRPGLRVLAMSATLDGARFSALMDDAPVVTSEGRTYPVEPRYLGRPQARAGGRPPHRGGRRRRGPPGARGRVGQRAGVPARRRRDPADRRAPGRHAPPRRRARAALRRPRRA